MCSSYIGSYYFFLLSRMKKSFTEVMRSLLCLKIKVKVFELIGLKLVCFSARIHVSEI